MTLCVRKGRAQGSAVCIFWRDRGHVRGGRRSARVRSRRHRIESTRSTVLRPKLSPDCSLAAGQDLPALLSLTHGAFQPVLPRQTLPSDKANELFAEWVRRGVCDSDSFTFLSRVDGNPAGLLSGRITPEGGRIDLVAVSPELRARGTGRRLMEASAAEFFRRGARRAAVGTQGSNVAAQRLYQDCGFKTRSVGVWFHGWY
jgi:ribosomal protein S18 acetylase RimI-like enzyme